MNEYFMNFICQHRYNAAKAVKSRTVSTGQKGSKSAYNCTNRYVSEETHSLLANIWHIQDINTFNLRDI